MSLPVFLHPDVSTAAPGQHLYLDGPEGRHAVTVKRLGLGEELELVDGHHPRRIRGRITATQGKDRLEVEVLAVTEVEAPSPRVTVVQALPKAERSELAIDLGTQAGADAFVAWQADRSVAKWQGAKAAKGVAKWQSQAVAAAKQARRTLVPQVSGPIDTTGLVAWLEAEKPDAVLVLHEAATRRLKDLELPQAGHVVLLVGPEGGIGEAELSRLQQAGATPVVLGKEVLRTASASMVALSAIGMLTSRW